jgi:EAL domain-containing protein (putative c-di-GMP-specific phosphodiesterase class I)
MILANKLGKEVVAEGVELEEHRAALASLSCRYGQGFLFSKPLDAEGATALLTASGRSFGTYDAAGLWHEDFEQVGSVYAM